jgi:hypothetical protein
MRANVRFVDARCTDHAIIDDSKIALLLTKVASMTGRARLNSVPIVGVGHQADYGIRRKVHLGGR